MMISEYATVIKTHHGAIHVQSANSSCSGCIQNRSCSSAALSEQLKKKPLLLKTDIDVTVGDNILVSIDENLLLRTVLTLYILPLITMFTGIGLASIIINNEYWLAFIGCMCLLSTFACLRQKQNHQALPAVIEKI